MGGRGRLQAASLTRCCLAWRQHQPPRRRPLPAARRQPPAAAAATAELRPGRLHGASTRCVGRGGGGGEPRCITAWVKNKKILRPNRGSNPGPHDALSLAFKSRALYLAELSGPVFQRTPGGCVTRGEFPGTKICRNSTFSERNDFLAGCRSGLNPIYCTRSPFSGHRCDLCVV